MTFSEDMLLAFKRNAEAGLARAGAFAMGQIGVAALHLGIGTSLAVALLYKVDCGELNLTDMV